LEVVAHSISLALLEIGVMVWPVHLEKNLETVIKWNFEILKSKSDDVDQAVFEAIEEAVGVVENGGEGLDGKKKLSSVMKMLKKFYK
jgi:hypothetical protein